MDFEDEIDPVFGQLNDFRIHCRGKPARPAIHIKQAADISLNFGSRIDDPGPEANLGTQRLIINLAVTFKCNSVDDRVLDHLHDKRITFATQRDVGEQSGVEEVLE